MMCHVVGTRAYTRDLPQGGLEIPCQYIFRGKPTEIAKVKKVLFLVLRDRVGVHFLSPSLIRGLDNETQRVY